MSNKENILIRRFAKLEKHFQALRDYHTLIRTLLSDEDILTPERFNFIPPRDKAVFDAYIKRFASIQDLRFCIDQFEEIEGYYHRAKVFAGRYTDALV